MCECAFSFQNAMTIFKYSRISNYSAYVECSQISRSSILFTSFQS